MKNIMLAAIFGLALVFVIPAMAEGVGQSSIGINYSIAYDSIGTRGNGFGVQFNYDLEKAMQAPVGLRVAYMSLSGTYNSGITWDANVIGVGWMFYLDTIKPNFITGFGTPYGGIGIVNATVNTKAVNTAGSLLSPVAIVGFKYSVSDSIDLYYEFNSIAGTQAPTFGANYKF